MTAGYSAESQFLFSLMTTSYVFTHSLVHGLSLGSIAEHHLPAAVNVLAVLSQSGLDGSFPIMGTCHVRDTDAVRSFRVKSVTRNGLGRGNCHVRETDMVHSFRVKSDSDTTPWCYPEAWM
jgi:hypothetical protein